MRREAMIYTLVLACCLLTLVGAADQPAKVDINKASLAELDTLPGIGPAIAARIIEFRTRYGPFKRPEDLMNVRGIGEKKFLKLKGFISASGAVSSGTPSPRSSRRKSP
jgi:comEA protein